MFICVFSTKFLRKKAILTGNAKRNSDPFKHQKTKNIRREIGLSHNAQEGIRKQLREISNVSWKKILNNSRREHGGIITRTQIIRNKHTWRNSRSHENNSRWKPLKRIRKKKIFQIFICNSKKHVKFSKKWSISPDWDFKLCKANCKFKLKNGICQLSVMKLCKWKN